MNQPQQVSRAELEAKLRQIDSGVRHEVTSRKGAAVKWGVVAGIGALLLVYFLGRMGGKKRSSIVEIRRL